MLSWTWQQTWQTSQHQHRRGPALCAGDPPVYGLPSFVCYGAYDFDLELGDYSQHQHGCAPALCAGDPYYGHPSLLHCGAYVTVELGRPARYLHVLSTARRPLVQLVFLTLVLLLTCTSQSLIDLLAGLAGDDLVAKKSWRASLANMHTYVL
ncbi:hypothetical protein E5Q_05280 [Mixia osmundae IAM 14324]|uniref:Uncharacterized protein n=1 Tax=Mixia osmundae (strain CBS 9802 / IAM 14324 / JCM 22182 / KY 12970) TaxID=764103 RepID=G7E6Y3_MIXOS|nr:hypothetical protein E5Q_05280 [Mixia osmundae IAM 14324]